MLKYNTSNLGDGNAPPPPKNFNFLKIWEGISNFWVENPTIAPLHTPNSDSQYRFLCICAKFQCQLESCLTITTG